MLQFAFTESPDAVPPDQQVFLELTIWIDSLAASVGKYFLLF